LERLREVILLIRHLEAVVEVLWVTLLLEEVLVLPVVALEVVEVAVPVVVVVVDKKE
jgi:hypothetical protein